MSDELKPCSHCEGVGTVAYDGWSEAGVWACVQCQTCKICTESCLDISDAIAAWNRRPIEDALRARIDALEWLREVETALESIQDWHPHWQRYIYDPDAGARYDDALLELEYIVENARDAVES